MSEKFLLERRAVKISQNERRLVDLGLENGVCLSYNEEMLQVKERRKCETIVCGESRCLVRIKQNNINKMNMVKNYHETKKRGNLIEEKNWSIEMCLWVGLGMRGDTEKMSCDRGDKGDKSNNIKYQKMLIATKKKWVAMEEIALLLLAALLKGRT